MNDNIVFGFGGWAQPYRFVIYRHVRWDKSQMDAHSMYIVDDPAMAYIVYFKLLENDKHTAREALYSWVLQDSFGKDALVFCKNKAENNTSSPLVKEKNG